MMPRQLPGFNQGRRQKLFVASKLGFLFEFRAKCDIPPNKKIAVTGPKLNFSEPDRTFAE